MNNVCNLCPNACNVDRTLNRGACGVFDKIKIAKYYLHPYEEPCISGENGSGTVFFTGCNMNCKFCWHRNAGLQYGTITNEMIDNLLNYWYNNFNEYSIVFAVLGGEPTLYPERIDHLARKQFELYGTCGLRVYTNGTVNLPEMLEICHEHENVTFQVSQNYEMIKYGDFYKYCDVASLVVTDDDSIDSVYKQCEKIKKLGYKKSFINFDLTDRSVQNPHMAYARQREILKTLIPLLDKDFAV